MEIVFFQVALNHGSFNYRLVAICIEDFVPFHHTVPHTHFSPSFSLRSYETFPRPKPQISVPETTLHFPPSAKKIAGEARCIVGVRPPPPVRIGAKHGNLEDLAGQRQRLRLPIGWAEEKEEAGDQKKLRTRSQISKLEPPAPGAATRPTSKAIGIDGLSPFFPVKFMLTQLNPQQMHTAVRHCPFLNWKHI